MKDNEDKRDEAWSKLSKSLAQVNDFVRLMATIEPESTRDLAYENNPFTKDGTQRVHARTSTEIVEWADRNHREFGFRSRELMIGSTLAFALAHQEHYNRFLTKARASTEDSSIEGISKSANSEEDSNGQSVQSTDSPGDESVRDNTEVQTDKRAGDMDRESNPDEENWKDFKEEME